MEAFLRQLVRVVVVSLVPAGLAGAAPQKLLVPQPKQVEWSAQAPIAIEPEQVAIVLGDKAVEPERQAARMLRERVAQRYGQDWPVVAESQVLAGSRVLILLGQRSTHAMLERACGKLSARLSPEDPGHDGYVIAFGAEGTRTLVLVGGGNARGVIYGQDTLFQMIAGKDGKLALSQASVRDWPTVPWRGRPQTHYKHYLEPGAMDCLMTSRINWIDLREGVYAFEAGTKLDKDVIKKVIDEAHTRDLVVYGTVNCGVPASKRQAVLDLFGEFIDLGADGLWLSFDDKGPGEQPEVMASETIKLAKARGIKRLAVCPPKGSYQEIDTEFDRKMLDIPGMGDAMWMWTRIPCEQDFQTATRMGLKSKPGWWHNWTRPASGLTHIESNSLNVPGKRSYMPVPSMAEGWHAPGYEQLSAGGKYCESVMPWGGQGWGQYYIVPVIGWWGWAPEKHDFSATRARIYDIVYGPEQVETARAFDDLLFRVRKLFAYAVEGSEWLPLHPAMLKRLEDRDQAISMLAELDKLAAKLAESGCAGSLLAKESLDELYVSAMRNEVATGQAEARLESPEYWWNDHQRKVLDAVHGGDLARADELAASVRERLNSNVARIETDLTGLKIMPDYVAWWRKQGGLDGQGWQKLIEERRKELGERVSWYGYAVEKLDGMLADADSPPLGTGTGRWERQNLVLASVLPDTREQWWGNWMAGLYHGDGRDAAVFAYRRRTEGAPGDFAELPVTLPLSGDRSRLGLMIFMSNVDKDEIGLHYVPRRWSGHRRIQLLNGNVPVWEADLGLPRAKGEWYTVALPELPANLKELQLTLRVEDLKETRAHAIAFVGPILLVQLPE